MRTISSSDVYDLSTEEVNINIYQSLSMRTISSSDVYDLSTEEVIFLTSTSSLSMRTIRSKHFFNIFSLSMKQ